MLFLSRSDRRCPANPGGFPGGSLCHGKIKLLASVETVTYKQGKGVGKDLQRAVELYSAWIPLLIAKKRIKKDQNGSASEKGV